MNTTVESYSVMPISNTAVTLYGLMRGVMPIGVTAPRGVTGVQRKLIGEPAADGDALALVETLERALLDVLGDRGEVVEIVGANAADQNPGCVERRGCQRLAIDNRRGEPDAGNLADAVGDVLPVGQRRFQRLHQQMSVEAENLVQQFLTEAIHDRHHNDQGGDPKHDAEEREARDDGNEAFLATRTQIAPRHQPFEGRKGKVPNWLAHGCIHRSIFTRFGLIVADGLAWRLQR